MQITVGEYAYYVEHWKPGMPVARSTSGLAIDTETEMIVPGKPVVPVVMQVCSQEQKLIHIVDECYIDQYLNKMFYDNIDCQIVFHNAPFDLNVLGLKDKNKNLWITLIQKNRIVDTGMRYVLRKLSLGVSDTRWSLDYVAKDLLNIVVPKDEDIRLTFKKGMVLTDRYIRYAAADAAVTIQLFKHMPHAYPTEYVQLVGSIALDDIGRTGMLVDLPYMQNLKNKFEETQSEKEDIMAVFGFYAGEKGNQNVLQSILKNIESEMQFLDNNPKKRFSRTEKKGEIQVTDASLSVLGKRNHPFLDAYREFKHNQKIISTYLNTDRVHWDSRVHPRFSPLVRTGRTACSQPNIQNLPREENIRGMYKAPDGWLLYAADYSQLELCALAQSCLFWQGKSKMADIINEGQDLHRWFASVVLDKDPSKITKDERQIAKACNFGFPGGLGLEKFQGIAKQQFGVDLTIERCDELKRKWLDAFPEMRSHLRPPEDKNSDEGFYIGRTITNRVRRKTPYCAACNYVFQGLSADGAKLALWFLFVSGYRMVNFIHDEVIIELKEDDNLQDHVRNVNNLMIRGMKKVIPNVRIEVEGALMRRWHKGASPVYENEKLLVWEPA